MKAPNVYIGSAKHVQWRTDTTPDDDEDRGMPREVIQILGFNPMEGSMEKARYARRWRGPDGKYRYDYGTDSQAAKKGVRRAAKENADLLGDAVFGGAPMSSKQIRQMESQYGVKYADVVKEFRSDQMSKFGSRGQGPDYGEKVKRAVRRFSDLLGDSIYGGVGVSAADKREIESKTGLPFEDVKAEFIRQQEMYKSYGGKDMSYIALEKAKYTRRYRGPDGKWQYEYGQKKGRSKGPTGHDSESPAYSRVPGRLPTGDELRGFTDALKRGGGKVTVGDTAFQSLPYDDVRVYSAGDPDEEYTEGRTMDRVGAWRLYERMKKEGGIRKGMRDIALVVMLEGQETLEKAKYTRRWKGPDGKYRYEYGQKKGRRGSKTSSSDESEGSGPSKVEMETFEVLDDSSSENSRNMIREAVQANGREAVINHLHSYVQGNQSFQREGWNKKTITQLVSRSTSKKLKKSSHGHPAKLSKVAAKAETNNPSNHKERMKFARMFAEMCGAPKPEDEGAHQPPTVDHKGRVAGQKAPHDKGSTKVGGMGSQAHSNFGAGIRKPSDIGASAYTDPATGGKVIRPKG